MNSTHGKISLNRGARSVLLIRPDRRELHGCESTDPDNQATGSLTLTVSGLPDATEADITISGPAGFSLTQAVGAAPVTLTDLAPGSYDFTAAIVSSARVAYVPIPVTQTAQVPSAGVTTVNTAFGSLAFALEHARGRRNTGRATAFFTDVTSITADFYFYNINSNTLTLKAPAGDALFNFASAHLVQPPGQRNPRQAGECRPLDGTGRVAGPGKHLPCRV